MATRTAPTVDGTPTFYKVKLRWIDGAGKLRSTSYRITAAADLDIEAFAAAMQAPSNASLWEIGVESVYSGAKSPTNATDAVRESVWDNIVILMANANGQKFDMFLPAPEEAVFTSTDTSQPDITNAELLAIITTMQALQLVTYNGESMRFTERKDKNQRVLI